MGIALGRLGPFADAGDGSQAPGPPRRDHRLLSQLCNRIFGRHCDQVAGAGNLPYRTDSLTESGAIKRAAEADVIFRASDTFPLRAP